MNLFNDITNGKAYTLERLPKSKKGDLRAWDAADELLQRYFYEQSLNTKDDPILLINDVFGALAVGFNNHSVHSWSDSAISNFSTIANYQNNNLDLDNYRFIPSTTDLNNQYDLVIIKIPKTLALLEDQLCKLKPHIHAKTCVIAGAMTKHIHNSTLKLFEKIIGTTTTSRATRKARLIFANNDVLTEHKSPYPIIVKDNHFNISLNNYANVFSSNHLDIGTRFFLEQLSKCPTSEHILDLGCGNGALGIFAQRLQPEAQLSFVDESYMAIASAKENFKNNTGKSNANFFISNSLDQINLKSNQNHPDLILCNPPFHQAHSIGDQIAWQMFKQSYDLLKFKGELWVIGNRHLAYHVKLKRLFGNCKTINANKKFVVLASVKN